MNKHNRTPLCFGSFEQLESRALLAHAGLPQGLFFEMPADQQTADFNRGPHREMHANSMHARDISSIANARGPRDSEFRGDFGPPNHSSSDSIISDNYGSGTSFETAPAILFIPSAPVPVLIIITLPSSVPTSPQISDPVTSSVRSNPPQSQRVSSFTNPTSSNLQSTSSANRSRSTSPLSLDSLSVLSDTTLKRTTSTDALEATGMETAAQATQDDEQPVRDEQESQQLIRQPVASETALQTNEADEDADLIELDPAELLKRTKRKSARVTTTNLESSSVRESALNLERRLPRAADLQPAEIWLHATQADGIVAPVNDDLIELLATDQMVSDQSPVIRSTPFMTPANLQLEANLGFHQAAESVDAATAVEAQPAAVAAAALPGREAQ